MAGGPMLPLANRYDDYAKKRGKLALDRRQVKS